MIEVYYQPQSLSVIFKCQVEFEAGEDDVQNRTMTYYIPVPQGLFLNFTLVAFKAWARDRKRMMHDDRVARLRDVLTNWTRLDRKAVTEALALNDKRDNG